MTETIDSVFLTSVQTAVGTSVSQSKPLVVYIASSGDSQWIDSLMSPEILTLIHEKGVGLKLLKDTAECQMFEQVFPNAQAPSVFIVRVQAVLDVIHGDVTKEDFSKRIKQVLDLPAQAPVQIPTTAQTHSTPQREATTQLPPQQSTAATTAHEDNTSSSETTAPVPQVKKTLKEQSSELVAKRYREEQLRLKETQREERERIRRLLKADEEERRSKDRERRLSMKGDDINDAGGDSAIKTLRENIKKPRSTASGEVVCALSLRLLDGHSVQHVFKPTETLSDVRKWLDDNRTDGGAPYAFHRMIPRVTYEASDEEKTLESLELIPRSALILKPFNSYTEAYSHTASAQGGIISRVWNGLSSFWGAQPQGHNPAQGQHRTQAEPFQHTPSYEPYRDNIQESSPQSPVSSHYVSPMHSPEAAELAIGMSHPSALNLNLNPDMDQQPQRSRTPLIGGEGLPLPATLSRMSSNIRTLNDQTQDDRATYNGNHLSLEDENKNKEQR